MNLLRKGVKSRCVLNGLAFFGMLAIASGAAAQQMMQVVQNAPGFQPVSSFQNFGKGESVNLANGGLTVTHPSAISLPQNRGALLQPTRVYNSKDPELSWSTPDPAVEAVHGAFGVGWNISYGRVFLRVSNVQVPATLGYASRCDYFYSDESGAEHRLYQDSTIEPYNGNSEQPSDTNWYVTNDMSFIRARYSRASTQWTVYFPDGSTRVAGGTNAFVAQVPGPRMQNSDGTYWWFGVANPRTNGWWVTKIQDRAGNIITIDYVTPNSNAATPPYPGSISTITDQFGRVITFGYDGNGLATSITGAGMTETLSYDTAPFPQYPNLNRVPTSQPVLKTVTAPKTSASDLSGVQTRYSYGQSDLAPPDVYAVEGTYLSKIGYPTGAISYYLFSTYTYVVCRFPANPNQYECNDNTSDGVAEHRVELAALDPLQPPVPALNKLVWTYKRDWQPGFYLGRDSRSVPVVVCDPLKTEEVHFFTVNDQGGAADVTPGKEIVIIRYKPGRQFDVAAPHQNRIFETQKYYEWGDRKDNSGNVIGDCKRCLQDGMAGPEEVPKGNSRVWNQQEVEYDSVSGNKLWENNTASGFWDGFGHFLVTQFSGEGIKLPRVTASNYDLKRDLNATPYLYQLDRLVLQYLGSMNPARSKIPKELQLLADRPTPPPSPLAATGEFGATKSTYTAQEGLLATKTSYRDMQPSFNMTGGTQTLTPDPPAGTTGNVLLTLSYTNSAQNYGNISRLVYSGGAGAQSFFQDFQWAFGMVSHYWWGDRTFGQVVPPYYFELQRSIDPTTSRITTQTEPDGLVTGYTYWNDGRLKTVTPPGDANRDEVLYPLSTSQWDAETWYVGRVVKRYQGRQATVPDLTPGTTPVPPASLPATDLYSVFTFDDLGRLWKTDVVMPDGSWSETTKFYDVLGRGFFSSEAYAFGSVPVLALTTPDLNASLVPTYLSNFQLSVPNGTKCALGTWDMIYAESTCVEPFKGALEPFYRTLKSFTADGALTSMSYYMLSSTKTQWVWNGSVQASSSTTLTKDASGRLVGVTAPAGVDASYEYNGIGNLVTVSLKVAGVTAQTRSFLYNGLGQMTEFTQPETGRWYGYTYDALGHLLTHTDAKGQAFKNSYDEQGRLTQLERTNMTPMILLQNTYDQGSMAQGKLTSAIQFQVDAASQTKTTTQNYSYRTKDGLVDTLTQVSTAYGSQPPLLSVTYDYDANKQVTSQAISPATGGTLVSSYAHGAVAGRTLDAAALLGSVTYTSAGGWATVQMNNGFVQKASYDEMSRPTGFGLTKGGTAVWANGVVANPAAPYTYDYSGNIMSIGNLPSLGGADTFVYDALSRLTQANVYQNTNQQHAYTYAYDEFGNLVQRVERIRRHQPAFASVEAFLTAPVSGDGCGLNPAQAEPYLQAVASATTIKKEHGQSTNRLETVTRGGLIGGVATGIPRSVKEVFYDPNGNLTDDGTYLYEYDPLNRQAAVRLKTSNQLLAQYFYESSGERVAVIRYEGGIETEYTVYLRDGAAVLYEKSLALPAFSEKSEKTYVYAPGGMGATRQTAYLPGPATTTFSYYGVDHLGTVRATVTVDTNGTETARSLHDYEPYGIEIPPMQASLNTHRFARQERDVETENDYMHFRYYSPGLGRFMRPDNVNGTMTNPQSWNLYSYVLGNPINFNDPTGHNYAYDQHWNPDRNSDMGLAGEQRPDPGSDYYQITQTASLNGEVLASQTRTAMGGPNDEAFVTNLESLLGELYVTAGGHQGVAGLFASLFGVDCTGLVRTAINMTLQQAGQAPIGDFTTSTSNGKPILVGEGASIFREKQAGISKGDVVVLKSEGGQHTVVSLGGSRFIEASGTALHVIVVDLSKADNPGYRFSDQAKQLREYFTKPYTVYDINWPH